MGGSLKITKIETIRVEPVPNTVWQEGSPQTRQASPGNLWVRIYSDTGLVGLGETYYVPRAVSAVIHVLIW
jgi:galactonate dehydratase